MLRAIEGDGLAAWREGLAQLRPEKAPCPIYRSEEWAGVLARAHAFLDRFGEEAQALGWTAARLFGVHPRLGTGRIDFCGLLVLPHAGVVEAITATEIRFGRTTSYTTPGRHDGVPWWGFREAI